MILRIAKYNDKINALMKRFFYTLFAILAFVACSESDVDNGGNNGGGQTPPKQPEITLGTTAADFSTDGGSNVITFTSSEAWTAQVVNTRADDWCSIDPTSGPAGSAKITVTTTENDTPDDRTASIIIKAGTASKTINVSQKQKDALTVTSSKFEVSAEGGEVSIEVKANIDFEYTIEESAADWVEYKATRALKTSNLVFEVKENNDTDKREARIVISSDDMEEIVTIYQEGSEPSIILTENEFTVSSSAETIAVEVKSNVDVTVEIPTDADWIMENTTRAFSTNTYYFDIEQNDGYDNRTAQIKFTNKATGIYEYVTVTQMQRDAIVVAKDSYTVDSEGDEIVIEVGHNIDFDIEIADDWITRKETRAFKTDKLTFVIAANKGYDNRESTIKFTSKDRGITQTVKVYQAQENALIVSKKDIVVSDKGGDVEFVIQTNVEFTVSKPDVSWLREVTTRGLTSHTLRYEVDPNTSYDSREAKIVVTNRKDNTTETITITQAQKDAIVLAKSEYELGTEGGELDFDIQTNVDITVTISDTAKSWITQIETRGLETKTLHFDIAACTAEEDREGTITISGGNAKQTITIKQSSLKEILEKEREALIALYKATDGDNWTNNENWCSNKPLNQWSGVFVNNKGLVEKLSLRHRNIQGVIPESIGQLSELKYLDMYGNNIYGPLPDSLANCTHLQLLELANNPLTGAILPSYWGQNMKELEYLNIYNTNLSGEIPKSIGGMKKLKKMCLGSNKLSGSIPESIGKLSQLKELLLSVNELTGSIPESIASLSELQYLTLANNKFNGTIPKKFQETEMWKNCWPDVLQGNEFNLSNVKFYGPSFKNVKTLDGNIISDDVYSKNKITILCTWLEWADASFIYALKDMYAKYKDMGLDIICYSKEKNINVIKDFIQKHSIEWTTFSVEENKDNFLLKNTYYPFVNIIDQNGEIINTSIYGSIEYNFPNDLFIALEYDKYESTDYSKDGKVNILQTATKGNGVDIVLMGDAFTDRQIADGTYDNVMKTAMEKFFSEEPYKSFRNHFNVYSITCVSKHDIYGEKYGKKYATYSDTALECQFGIGTQVGGNHDKVLEYADKIGISDLLNSTIIVVMNSIDYAGTCYMYTYPESNMDWGMGLSISYFPKGKDEEALKEVINHETGGHGFAKLADEYAYENYGTIPSSEIQEKMIGEAWGWWKNVDFTNDPTKVKWRHFLSDSRYVYDDISIYEGACTYWTGVYRPSFNSIMRYNTGGFNAPSREAIYYRIHKLAYGPDWEYDYEEFVKWDEKNRNKEQTRGIPYRLDIPEDFQPTHPPVVINKSWKDAR